MEGAVSGGLDPFRVECDSSSQGNQVNVVGVLKVGSGKAFAFINLMPDAIRVNETMAGPPPVQRQYAATTAGVSTVTTTGAHLDGDVVEQSPSSGTAHALHLVGDVTCGSK